MKKLEVDLPNYLIICMFAVYGFICFMKWAAQL